MIILGIETSCDETAVSVVRGTGELKRPKFKVLAHVVSSQVKIHAPYGGVVPMLAKREHSKNLIPVLKKALNNSKLKTKSLPDGEAGEKQQVKIQNKISKILAREPELLEQFLKFIPTMVAPKIDAIAVTHGPGLEPALWAGINFARALALAWHKPLLPINHMEGHIYSVLTQSINLKFPSVALLISGGHTELVLIHDWLKHTLIGASRDDAVGEAFDKVARLLGLPYPGGPALSKLAKSAKRQALSYSLPRPMLHSENFDFSFSGLKTAVLYRVNDLKKQNLFNDRARAHLAVDFQQAVIDVLLAKTAKTIEKYHPKTLIIAGGVSANQPLRKQFSKHLAKNYPTVNLLLPEPKLTMDNATMIAVAGYLRLIKKSTLPNWKADGNLTLD